MKFFVDNEGVLAAAADNCVNPDGLPILEIDELPAPIHYCRGRIVDNAVQIVVDEDWQEKEKELAVVQFKKQLDILVEQRISQLMQPDGFKSLAEVLGFAANEGPLQEKAKALTNTINTYRTLAQEVANGEISMQALLEFRDLLASE